MCAFCLETPRLLLRHVQPADAVAFEYVFCDAEVMHFSDGVKSPAWVRDWLTQVPTAFYTGWGFGPYAVVERAHSAVLGYCGLFRFDAIEGVPEIEIGYRLARAAWGRGVATEAALAVRDYAFDVLGLRRVVALIDPANTASLRVAQKLGMQYEKDVMLDGYTHPDQLYALAQHL
jgi:[ribosomal protein S5]-alanine N-acetyltransferase